MVKFNEYGQGYFYFAEFEKSSSVDVVNEFGMRLAKVGKRLPVAAKLTEEQYEWFLSTYAKHNRSMGLDMRKKYAINNVKKVVAAKDGTLHVHYSDGNWWHYTKSGTWY